MKKKQTSTIVMELNHSGIPDSELKPEEFDEQQLAVLNALDSTFQEKIRRGCPIHVVDMKTGEAVARFNIHNVKPSDFEMQMLARSLLDRFLEWRKDPENQKKLEDQISENKERKLL